VEGSELCSHLNLASGRLSVICDSAERYATANPALVDTGGPGRIVRGVVLRPERFQPELSGHKAIWHREVDRNEGLATQSVTLMHPTADAGARLE